MNRQDRNLLIREVAKCEMPDVEHCGNDPIVCDFFDELDANGKYYCTDQTKWRETHKAMSYLGIESTGDGCGDEGDFTGSTEVGIDVLSERAIYLQMVYDL